MQLQTCQEDSKKNEHRILELSHKVETLTRYLTFRTSELDQLKDSLKNSEQEAATKVAKKEKDKATAEAKTPLLQNTIRELRCEVATLRSRVESISKEYEMQKSLVEARDTLVNDRNNQIKLEQDQRGKDVQNLATEKQALGTAKTETEEEKRKLEMMKTTNTLLLEQSNALASQLLLQKTQSSNILALLEQSVSGEAMRQESDEKVLATVRGSRAAALDELKAQLAEHEKKAKEASQRDAD